ncbi:MAG: C39 family peptidase [Lachnospiraceae bacterium]|nr:C39 family peptidase [Lachnospiraceae bacterium]
MEFIKEVGIKTDPEMATEPEADMNPEPVTETKPESDTEPETLVETEKETESETEPEKESETETEPEPESTEKEPKKDDQKAIYEYDESGELIGKTVNGIWYIWDDDYGYQEGIRLNKDRVIDQDAVKKRKASIQMTSVLQLPELPTGCEIVSTYMVLKYLHFPIGLMKFTNRYFKNENKSADFRHYFVGDPYTPYGLGCYAPCIVNAVNKYLEVCESDYIAYNYTGYSFESLMNQVADGYPVIFWGTQYMKEPFLSTSFQIGDETIRWISQEHCMVLTGFDLDKGLATVYDPLVGIVQYDLNKLKGRFLQLGSQAVIIKKQDVGYDKKNQPRAFLYDPNIPKQ